MQKWLPVQKGEHYHIEESPFPVFIEQPDMVRRDAERAAPLFSIVTIPPPDRNFRVDERNIYPVSSIIYGRYTFDYRR
jgi:hypothetical protein